MEILLIFFGLVMMPLLVALPFYLYQRYTDKRELEAQNIVDILRGLEGPRVDWFTGF